jgi:hypothetical protein
MKLLRWIAAYLRFRWRYYGSHLSPEEKHERWLDMQ